MLPKGDICGHGAGQPLPEVWSLGLGGGSIARMTDGVLAVGPESAGALPGPACFDLGGTDATVTDACLVLGFFAPDGFFGGRRRLRLDLARRALERLSPDAEPLRTAAAIKETTEEQVALAIRSHGGNVDLTGARILALGGGGGLHAASIAAKLGLRDVDVVPFSPAFGAFGASTLDVVHVYQASLEGRGAMNGRLPLGAWYGELVATARRDVEDEGFASTDLAFELVLEHAPAEPGGAPSISRHAVGAEQEFVSLPDRTSPHMAWLRARHLLGRLRWEPSEGSQTRGSCPSPCRPLASLGLARWSAASKARRLPTRLSGCGAQEQTAPFALVLPRGERQARLHVGGEHLVRLLEQDPGENRAALWRELGRHQPSQFTQHVGLDVGQDQVEGALRVIESAGQNGDVAHAIARQVLLAARGSLGIVVDGQAARLGPQAGRGDGQDAGAAAEIEEARYARVSLAHALAQPDHQPG